MMNTAIASVALFGTSALAGAYGYSATAVGNAHVIVSPRSACSPYRI